MSKISAVPFGGLANIPGVRFAIVSSLRKVTCPLCNTEDIALIAGHVSFSAKIKQENLPEASQTLAGFVCRNSHLFFLRDSDVAVVTAKSSA